MKKLLSYFYFMVLWIIPVMATQFTDSVNITIGGKYGGAIDFIILLMSLALWNFILEKYLKFTVKEAFENKE